MPSSYTSSLRLTLPVQGELSGSWGNTVNTGITQLVDTAVAGTATITMTAADYTLSNNNGVTDEARAMFLVLGGTPGAARNVICPAVSKLYYVTNNTTGGFAQTVKTASGSGISVPNGASMVLRCDGTNVVEAQNSLGSIVLNGGTANGVAYLNASKALTTGSGLVFDGSNLGLGVTPSAWSGVTALQLPTGAALTGFSNTTNLAQNAYYNGSWRYISTAAAALAQVTQGAHQWFTAPSGIAGVTTTIVSGQSYTTTGSGNQTSFGAPNNNVGTTWTATSSGTLTAGGVVQNITFTQAMTLDASGNLGVGTTSPAQRLDVVTTSATVAKFTRDLATDVSLTIGADNDGAIIGTDGVNVMRMFTGGSERARITSDGKLALGWPEARADLDVGTNTATAITKSIHLGFSDDDYYGFRIANANTASLTYAGTLAFQRGTGAAWADVVTITDGGNLLVNTSTIAGNGGYTFQVQAGGIAAINNNNSASTGYVFSSYRRGGVEIGSVTQNGTTAVLYNTTSDRRLKDNIVPAPSASDVIDAIEIVSHDWKAAPDEHVTYGVIAQDLALVAPQAVLQGDDGDEIEKTWGVDYSKLVPMLIKEIQSLRARVAALEAA